MRANFTCCVRTSIQPNSLVLSHKHVAQMVLFRKWYCLYMSDKNCGLDPKKKSDSPKKTLCIFKNTVKILLTSEKMEV